MSGWVNANLVVVSRPQWSWGNVLTLRSKVRRFKPSWGHGFFQDVKILSTSPPGGTLSWGPESEISGSLKNLKPEKIGPWVKFNRHIHVLVISKNFLWFPNYITFLASLQILGARALFAYSTTYVSNKVGHGSQIKYDSNVHCL